MKRAWEQYIIEYKRWLRLFGQFPADFKWISAGVY
jgi:hypothetical protein